MPGFQFIARTTLAWTLAAFIAFALWNESLFGRVGVLTWLFVAGAVVLVSSKVAHAFSHVRRVRLITGRVDASTLSNRQRRQIEIPFESGEAFDIVDATIRELPGSNVIESARDSLQVRAKVTRRDPYGHKTRGGVAAKQNQILATVTPGDGAGSVTLICEPEGGAWSDWFRYDDGSNLENAEAITRAIARRVADRRRGEQANAQQASTEKELTVAKLSLLHAQ